MCVSVLCVSSCIAGRPSGNVVAAVSADGTCLSLPQIASVAGEGDDRDQVEGGEEEEDQDREEATLG